MSHEKFPTKTYPPIIPRSVSFSIVNSKMIKNATPLGFLIFMRNTFSTKMSSLRDLIDLKVIVLKARHFGRKNNSAIL
jgi:hypothetical protein